MKQANLAVCFLVELCALATLAYWGFTLDAPIAVRVVLGVATPLIAAIAWGTYVAPRARLSAPASMRLAVLGRLSSRSPSPDRPAWPGHSPPLSSSIRR
jgi:Protein of unknown function (DUF2568)